MLSFSHAFRSQHNTCDCETCSTMTLDKYTKIPKVLDSMTNVLVLFFATSLLDCFFSFVPASGFI